MKAYLALEDGFILEGRSFTGPCEQGGEVVFTTSMGGYQEMLTDPAYTGHMVCMTWPLVGNYGINAEDMESSRVHVSALLVKECCKTPSNWRSTASLPDFLMEHGVPGIEGLDTRALTRHLRLRGSMRGVVTTVDASPHELMSMARSVLPFAGQNLVRQVSTAKPWAWHDNGPRSVELAGGGAYAWRGTGLPLAVMDYGITWNCIRQLISYGFEPLVLPAQSSAQAVRATGAKALFLSGGPGDPSALSAETDVIRDLAKTLPTAAINLGHHLLGQAFGATTTALPFGHHGSNHPVKELDSGRIEITAQNAMFCADISQNPELQASHINLNDNTLEGFIHKTLPVIAVQHTPKGVKVLGDPPSFYARFRDMVQACGF